MVGRNDPLTGPKPPLPRSDWIRTRPPAYGFPRITLLGSSVNRGKRKGRSLKKDSGPDLLAASDYFILPNTRTSFALSQ